MPRGKGVKLQTYREGGLRDATVFQRGGGCLLDHRRRPHESLARWREWLGRRAAVGKMFPKGFPATKRFRPKE
jgi:topoisomerase-4 subunit A